MPQLRWPGCRRRERHDVTCATMRVARCVDASVYVVER